MSKIKIIIILLLVIVLGVVMYIFINNKKEEYQYINLDKQYINITVSDVEENNDNKKLFSEYREKFNNDEIVGSINIDNSDFSMLFAKGNDNDYYLTHLLNKEKNKLGAVFLDYRCDIDNGRKINIYGHNNGNIGTSFNYLMNYEDKSFYDNHKRIIISSESKDYIYEIFSIQIVDTNYIHMKVDFSSDDDWIKYLYNVLDNSLYKEDIDVNSIDRVLTLQTCTNRVDWQFLLVNAKLVN